MANRMMLKYFASILGASLVFFGLASAGSSVADTYVFGKRFGDHTYAGPFNLSKQTEQDAEVKLTSDLLGMQDNLQADLLYQDTVIQLPAELVRYDAAETVAHAESEAENALVATVPEDGLRSLLEQELPMIQLSKSEIAAIAAGIQKKLETGIMPQSIVLTDYLEASQPTGIVADAAISVDGLTEPMMKLLEALDGYQLEPKIPFSLLEFAETALPGMAEDEELTLLASAMYEATLKTNFWVEDRTIQRQLMDGVKPGFEAAINPKLGLDYSMTNPNSTSYTLQTKWEGGALRVAIEGLPLRFDYEPYVAETEDYEPKTVIQYSGNVSAGQVRISEPGVDGVELIVQRRVTEDGEILNTEAVSEDFYPPISRVEQHPLIDNTDSNEPDDDSSSNHDGSDGGDGSENSPNSPGGNNSSGSGSGNGSDSSDGNDSTNGGSGNTNGGTSGNTGKPDSSSGKNPSTGKPGTSKDPDDQIDSVNGTPSSKPESDGHLYDKGGNLIK